MKKYLILLVLLLFLFGCIETTPENPKLCQADSDCSLILNGCYAGCWNKNFNPSEESKCINVLPPQTQCICQSNVCVEHIGLEGVDENKFEGDTEKPNPEAKDTKTISEEKDVNKSDAKTEEKDLNKAEGEGLNKTEEVKIEDPCDGVACTEKYKCVQGICIEKNCEELEGGICQKGSRCPGNIISSLDPELCCSVACEEVKEPYKITAQGIEYVDEDGFDHFVPYVVRGLLLSGGWKDFTLDGEKYLYKANPKAEIWVENNDNLNNRPIKVNSIDTDKVEINDGKAVRKGELAKHTEVEFRVDDIYRNNKVLLSAHTSFSVCKADNGECKYYPHPLNTIREKTIYLNNAKVYYSPGVHITFLGKNRKQFFYIPVINERPEGNQVYLVMESNSAVPIKAIDGTVIEFLGTDLDGDRSFNTKYEPRHYVIDNLNFGYYTGLKKTIRPFIAIFRVTKPDGGEEEVKVQVFSQ